MCAAKATKSRDDKKFLILSLSKDEAMPREKPALILSLSKDEAMPREKPALILSLSKDEGGRAPVGPAPCRVPLP